MVKSPAKVTGEFKSFENSFECKGREDAVDNGNDDDDDEDDDDEDDDEDEEDEDDDGVVVEGNDDDARRGKGASFLDVSFLDS